MNRDQIKYVAMFTMLLNHIANVFLEPGTFLFEVMVDVVILPLSPCATSW